VKFIVDEPIQVWLRNFVPDSEGFNWDIGNERKNIKHGVIREELESIFFQPYLFAGRIVEPVHDEWRGLILGKSANGRRLALIFTRRGNQVRPISCRSMRKEEQKLYEENF